MPRRHESLIPLSREHHDGLLLAWRIRIGDLAAREPALKMSHAVAFFESRLIAHFRAEEEQLFPAIRASLGADATLIDELIGEHRELARTAAALKAGDEAELKPWCDLLERHIRAEERRLFPMIEQRTDPATLDALGPEIRKTLGLA
jgi:iron-sulfur cluster repair protein YtfE (RIC family)